MRQQRLIALFKLVFDWMRMRRFSGAGEDPTARNSSRVRWLSGGQLPVFKTVCCCPRLVCLFLKRGADYNAKDKNQKDPITIAVDNANADIVTL